MHLIYSDFTGPAHSSKQWNWMKGNGWDGTRFWCVFNEWQPFDSDGFLTSGGKDKIRGYIKRVGRVIVVCANHKHFGPNQQKVENAVKSVVEATRDLHSKILCWDVMNESNEGKGYDNAALINVARTALGRSPGLIGVSKWMGKEGGDYRAAAREQQGYGADVNLIHTQRTLDWYTKTGERVKRIKRGLPVFMDEEHRNHFTRGHSFEPIHFAESAHQADKAGAKLWCWHRNPHKHEFSSQDKECAEQIPDLYRNWGSGKTPEVNTSPTPVPDKPAPAPVTPAPKPTPAEPARPLVMSEQVRKHAYHARQAADRIVKLTANRQITDTSAEELRTKARDVRWNGEQLERLLKNS